MFVHQRRPPAPPRAGGRLRHGVPPDDAGGGVHVRAALGPVQALPRAQVRLPRHVLLVPGQAGAPGARRRAAWRPRRRAGSHRARAGAARMIQWMVHCLCRARQGCSLTGAQQPDADPMYLAAPWRPRGLLSTQSACSCAGSACCGLKYVTRAHARAWSIAVTRAAPQTLHIYMIHRRMFLAKFVVRGARRRSGCWGATQAT